MIVSLPMYDWTECEHLTNAWWRGIRQELIKQGLTSVPKSLLRTRSDSDAWRMPDLLLSQTCGYPLTHDYANDLTLVATPDYRVEGCANYQYQSLILCHDRSPNLTLAEFKGSTATINDVASQSGFSAFRHSIAPLAQGAAFFERVTISGGHRYSMAALQSGDADICAVDPVSFALAKRYVPGLTQNLQIVTTTAPAPCLPYVTHASSQEVARLQHALFEACENPALEDVREQLFIGDFTFSSRSDYERILDMENDAIALHYPDLT